MRTIIIDDEPLGRALLTELLSNEADIEIIAECSDGLEGLKAIQEHKPDLIFLDVQMPKITGFEMLELLDNPPKTIFTTAFDEYAIKAFEVNAIDYLLKPIHPERLKKALERVKSLPDVSNKNEVPAIINSFVHPEYLNRIVVKTNGNIQILSLEEVYYIESADDYVKTNTEHQYFLKHQTMNSYEQMLPPDQFIRIHRSYLINILHIHKVELYEKDQYRAVLRNDTKLAISRSGYAKLKNILRL